MRVLLNLTFALLATISGFYLTWRAWQPNLNGHWHIVNEELQNGRCSIDYIYSIDFINNREFVIDDYPFSEYTLGGNINRLFRKAEIFGGCFSMEFDYHFEEKLLIIELEDPAGGAIPLRLRAKGPLFKCPISRQ